MSRETKSEMSDVDVAAREAGLDNDFIQLACDKGFTGLISTIARLSRSAAAPTVDQQMLAALEAVEWAGFGGRYGSRIKCCPSCGGSKDAVPPETADFHMLNIGHFASCPLAAAIARAKSANQKAGPQ